MPPSIGSNLPNHEEILTELLAFSKTIRDLSRVFCSSYARLIDQNALDFCRDVLSLLPDSISSIPSARANIISALYEAERNRPITIMETVNPGARTLEPVALQVDGETTPESIPILAHHDSNELPSEPVVIEAYVAAPEIPNFTVTFKPLPSLDATPGPAPQILNVTPKVYMEAAKMDLEEKLKQRKLKNARKLDNPDSHFRIRNAKPSSSSRPITLHRPGLSLFRCERTPAITSSNSRKAGSSPRSIPTLSSTTARAASQSCMASTSLGSAESLSSTASTPMPTLHTSSPESPSPSSSSPPPSPPLHMPGAPRRIGGADTLLMPPPAPDVRISSTQETMPQSSSSQPSHANLALQSSSSGLSRGSDLQRKASFYGKSNPDVFWIPEWGPMPNPSEAEELPYDSDGLPVTDEESDIPPFTLENSVAGMEGEDQILLETKHGKALCTKSIWERREPRGKRREKYRAPPDEPEDDPELECVNRALQIALAAEDPPCNQLAYSTPAACAAGSKHASRQCKATEPAESSTESSSSRLGHFVRTIAKVMPGKRKASSLTLEASCEDDDAGDISGAGTSSRASKRAKHSHQDHAASRADLIRRKLRQRF